MYSILPTAPFAGERLSKMNELDDFLCEQQSEELPLDWFDNKERFHLSRSTKSRKNNWKYAIRSYRLLRAKWGLKFLKHFKPLHYYSKTKPEIYYQRTNKTNNKGKHRNAYGNYNPSKNWSVADKRKIQDGEDQIKELFDNE